MPLVAPITLPNIRETNSSVSSGGTTITASATANAKGAYSSLIDPTSHPSYGIWVLIRNVSVTTAVQNGLVDIAYGPTGGGNEEIIIPDLNAGAAADASIAASGKVYFFPVYIPTGVRVSARWQASTASDTAMVVVWLDQNPLYALPTGRVAVYGRDATNSRGTSVTPGNSAFGTWTELLNAAGGSGLTRPHKFWIASMDQLADTTLTDARYGYLEVGVGPNNTTVSRVAGPFQFQEEATEQIAGPFPPMPQYGPAIVDSTNAKLWVRMAQVGATEARGVMVWGID